MTDRLKLFGNSEQQLVESEKDQGTTRLIVVSLMLAFVSIANIFFIRFDRLLTADIICQTIFVVSFLFTLGLNLHSYYIPRFAHERVVIGLIHDVVVTTAFLFFSREKFASLLFIYPWISIGHGFRFGESYLFIASLFTSFGMLMLFKLSPYWSTSVPSGFDIALIFVLVASYTGYLLRDLKAVKEVLKMLATRDPLTGLANRRIVEDQLPLMLESNRADNKAMGIVYFDLDGFKPVNDQLGHEAGDLLLKNVAHQLKKISKPDDVVARVGGDEFVVILKKVKDEEELKVRARAILASIQAINQLNGKKIEISASLGCLYVGIKTPKELQSGQKLIREADRLMYTSKRAGRGVLSIAKTEDLWTIREAAA